MDCQSHLHQIGLGVSQYFDNWGGQFFLHHPFDADVSSQVDDAESFAEIYWEDKIMPYVNPLYANEAIAKGGVQVADEKIFRCMTDVSTVAPYLNPDGTDRRDHQPDELPDELAAQPQDQALRPLDVPPVPAGDRHRRTSSPSTSGTPT